MRAGKSTLYEGGIRGPLIICWHKVIKPGTVCNTPTCNIDFYPTLLQLAGLSPDPAQHLDGVSILPLLKNPQAKLARNTLYWHYPLKKPHFLGGRSTGAIRQGDFKLIEFFDNGDVELYNLTEDIEEKNNLAQKLSEKAAELQKRLTQWRMDVGAKIPD